MNQEPAPAKRNATLWQSFGCAFGGLRHLFRAERNFRIHLGLAALAALFGWWLKFSGTEWCVVVLTSGLVIVTEVLNTSLETILDLLHPHDHPLVGRAKDLAAAAVLISAICAVMIAGLIAIPKLWLMFFREGT